MSTERDREAARQAVEYQRREREALTAMAWATIGDRRATPGAIAAARARLEDVAPDLGQLDDLELVLAEHVSARSTGLARTPAELAELAAACRQIAAAIPPPSAALYEMSGNRTLDPPPCARCSTIDERDVIRLPADAPAGALERTRAAIAAVARGEVELVVDG